MADRSEDLGERAVLVGALEEELQVRVQRVRLLVLEGAEGGVSPAVDPTFRDPVAAEGVTAGLRAPAAPEAARAARRTPPANVALTVTDGYRCCA